MRQLGTTRSELLLRRGQIALARLGRDLLTEKRDALKREFVRLSASALEAMSGARRPRPGSSARAEAWRIRSRALETGEVAALERWRRTRRVAKH